MTNHDEFLGVLLDRFPGQVFLVGRYQHDKLGLPEDGRTRVFLPDFHWMSRTCLLRYTGGYQFSDTIPQEQHYFSTLLGILEKAVKTGGVEIYQLGDRFDLWRETTEQDHDVLEVYNRLRHDPIVEDLADRLDALRPGYIRGNHDNWLGQVEPQIAAPPSTKTLDIAGGSIFLTHGNRYDTIESVVPEAWRAAGVALAPKVKPSRHAIGPFVKANIEHIQDFLALRSRPGVPRVFYPDVVPDGAILLDRLGDIARIEEACVTFLDASVFDHGTGDHNDFEHISYLTFADQIRHFESALVKPHGLHVIGHTHHARLLVDRRPNGRQLVTMDCGGWLENATVRVGNSPAYVAPSRQFGVQHGNDVRLYQIGGNLSPSPEPGPAAKKRRGRRPK